MTDGPLGGMSDGALEQAIQTAENVIGGLEHVDNLLPDEEDEIDVSTPTGKVADADARVTDLLLSLHIERNRRAEADDE